MVLEDAPELTAHLSRIASHLTDYFAFELDVVTGSIERYSHPATGSLCGYHPRTTDVARILRCHDLTMAALSDAPLGRACSVDDSLEFTTARES
jgi:hypothetical protein